MLVIFIISSSVVLSAIIVATFFLLGLIASEMILRIRDRFAPGRTLGPFCTNSILFFTC